MAVVGVIPARGGSQRFPRKNVVPIAGKPLITYTIEMALRASTLDAVIVSTDDETTGRIASGLGALVVVRPPELATPESPIDDALRHAAAWYRREHGKDVQIVVSLQANTPVRKEGEIDKAVRRLRNQPGASAVATGYTVNERLHWLKVLADPQSMEIRPLADVAAFRVQDLPRLYLLDGNIIAVRAHTLDHTAGDRRVHAYLGDRVLVLEHDASYATEVDEPGDVDAAESYLRAVSR